MNQGRLWVFYRQLLKKKQVCGLFSNEQLWNIELLCSCVLTRFALNSGKWSERMPDAFGFRDSANRTGPKWSKWDESKSKWREIGWRMWGTRRECKRHPRSEGLPNSRSQYTRILQSFKAPTSQHDEKDRLVRPKDGRSRIGSVSVTSNKIASTLSLVTLTNKIHHQPPLIRVWNKTLKKANCASRIRK